MLITAGWFEIRNILLNVTQKGGRLEWRSGEGDIRHKHFT